MCNARNLTFYRRVDGMQKYVCSAILKIIQDGELYICQGVTPMLRT